MKQRRSAIGSLIRNTSAPWLKFTIIGSWRCGTLTYPPLPPNLQSSVNMFLRGVHLQSNKHGESINFSYHHFININFWFFTHLLSILYFNNMEVANILLSNTRSGDVSTTEYKNGMNERFMNELVNKQLTCAECAFVHRFVTSGSIGRGSLAACLCFVALLRIASVVGTHGTQVYIKVCRYIWHLISYIRCEEFLADRKILL